MHRRLASLALTTLAIIPIGCTTRASSATAQGGTSIVVFVDFSESVDGGARLALKREIDREILPSLEPGDSILIAPIHDKTLTDFRPLVEADLPARPQFNGWMNNVMKYHRQAKETEARIVHVKETIRTETDAALARNYRSRYTDIFSSLLLAEKLFSAEPRRKILVLMSDMIEDYPPYAFDRMAWTPSTTDKLITGLDHKKMIANLSHVCVYVSGASAPSAELAENIGRFWETYFRKAGADLDSSRYAHVLLHWPPPPSCGAS